MLPPVRSGRVKRAEVAMTKSLTLDVSCLGSSFVEGTLHDLGTQRLAPAIDDQCCAWVGVHGGNVPHADVLIGRRRRRAARDHANLSAVCFVNLVAMARDAALSHHEADEFFRNALGLLFL